MEENPQTPRHSDGSEVVPVRLPRVANIRSPVRRETVTGRGINYTENISDGDLAYCRNLSARRWPALATKTRREKDPNYEGVTALFRWNGLVAVKGQEVWYRGTQVPGSLPGPVEAERQFAAVNSRLVIWPDKVYLDLADETSPKLVPMAVSLTATKFTFNRGTRETVQDGGYVSTSSWSTVQVTGAASGGEAVSDLRTVLKIGDGIELGGITGDYAANNRAVIIRGLDADTITIQGTPFQTATDQEGKPVETEVTGDGLTLSRRIPDLDFICESGNRLWGCSNESKTVYASVLGDPSNFYVYDGLSTDGYALPIGTEGDFTGCCRLSSSLLFWKEHRLHKIIGDYPAEYSMYTYELEGLRAGCHKSMQIINDVLFYVGLHGVFTYAGGTPSDVSRAFGDHVLTEAVGGTDGERYLLTCLDNGTPAFYVYSPDTGIWLREDETRARDFVRDGDTASFLDRSGQVWSWTDAGEPDTTLDWSLTFTPFRETVEGRKRFSRLLIRAELPLGAWMEAKVSCDGGRVESVGKLVGRADDVSQLWIRPNRCDRFEVTLSGHGPCVIRNVLREFRVEGDL